MKGFNKRIKIFFVSHILRLSSFSIPASFFSKWKVFRPCLYAGLFTNTLIDIDFISCHFLWHIF